MAVCGNPRAAASNSSGAAAGAGAACENNDAEGSCERVGEHCRPSHLARCCAGNAPGCPHPRRACRSPPCRGRAPCQTPCWSACSCDSGGGGKAGAAGSARQRGRGRRQPSALPKKREKQRFFHAARNMLARSTRPRCQPIGQARGSAALQASVAAAHVCCTEEPSGILSKLADSWPSTVKPSAGQGASVTFTPVAGLQVAAGSVRAKRASASEADAAGCSACFSGHRTLTCCRHCRWRW